MLDRPLRVTISTFEPQVEATPYSTFVRLSQISPCAVERRSLRSVVGCSMPGAYAEIYAMVFRHLNISRETHAASERKFSSGFSLQPDSPCGACDETTDTLDGLLGALANGTCDCGIGSWIAVPERMRRLVSASPIWERSTVVRVLATNPAKFR